jgi:hypothetical protein
MTSKNKTKKGGRISNYFSMFTKKSGVNTKELTSKRGNKKKYFGKSNNYFGHIHKSNKTRQPEYKSFNSKIAAELENENNANQLQIKRNGELAQQLQHEENARQLQEQIKKTKINSIHEYLNMQGITSNKYKRNSLTKEILNKCIELINNNKNNLAKKIIKQEILKEPFSSDLLELLLFIEVSEEDWINAEITAKLLLKKKNDQKWFFLSKRKINQKF